MLNPPGICRIRRNVQYVPEEFGPVSVSVKILSLSEETSLPCVEKIRSSFQILFVENDNDKS